MKHRSFYIVIVGLSYVTYKSNTMNMCIEIKA